MREFSPFVCDVWCDTFEMFPLRLGYTLTVVSVLTRFSLPFYTTLLLELFVVEQDVLLSATVGHLLLGLDTNVRIPKKTAPFDFGDS